MIELYINKQLCDLTEDIDISFTYQATELDTPTAEKNSFSKSVELKGTPKNNKIFGDAWKLDRNVLESSSNYTGVNFDARKRVDFILYENAEIIEQGYIHLDEITIDSDEITYSITLYGGLGDFFYGLMYDDEGEEKSLADLHYGFTGFYEKTDGYDEDKELMYWDKDYIWHSWTKLLHGRSEKDMTAANWITACPAYSGTYDDFDNSKVLVNYAEMIKCKNDSSSSVLDGYGEPYFNWVNTKAILPNDGLDDSGNTKWKDTTYSKGWMLCEATRDLDEWEAMDFRSIYQRPAIKTSIVMDSISDPDHNGGYEVVWDDEIKKSAYYKDSWIMFDRLDFDADETSNNVTELHMTGCNIQPWQVGSAYSGRSVDAPVYLKSDGTKTFDFSSFDNPRVELNLKNCYQIYNNGKTEQSYSCAFFKGYKSLDGATYTDYKGMVYGGYIVRLDAYVDGTLSASSKNYLVITSTLNKDYYNDETKAAMDNAKESFCSIHGLDPDNTVVITKDFIPLTDKFVSGGTSPSNKWGWDSPFTIDLDLPKTSDVTLKVHFEYRAIEYDPWDRVKSSNRVLVHQFSGKQITGSDVNSWLSPDTGDDDSLINGYYDGTINPNIQKTLVTKKILFANSETPYDYLIGFAKMIGAKFRSDVGAKRIYIQLRKNYYLGEGKNVENQIDRSQEIKINPTITEYKWYMYGFETPETYAQELYAKKNKTDYGKYKLDTGYYFNNEVNDLYEDVIYTSAIPYKHKSIYFNRTRIPTILMSPTYDYTTYDENLDSTTETHYGYANWSKVVVTKDEMDKLCCFDDDDGNVSDVNNCFVFYNGFVSTDIIVNEEKIPIPYIISDNLPIMSSLNENPCYIFTPTSNGYSSKTVSGDTIVYFIYGYPQFSKYLTNSDGVYTDSLDFKKPNYTFIGNDNLYQDGICIYDRYWKGYIEDLYDKNTRSVELKVFLTDKPNLAMRKFYYFDKSVWVINEITDYNAESDDPCSVTFVKVKDSKNYTDKDITWTTA